MLGPFISSDDGDDVVVVPPRRHLLPSQPSSVPVAVPPVSVMVRFVASSSATVGAVLLSGLVVGLARLGGLLAGLVAGLARLGGLLAGLRERVVVVGLPPPGDVRHRRRRSPAREGGRGGRRRGSRRGDGGGRRRGSRRGDGGGRWRDGGGGRRGRPPGGASLLGGRYEVLLGNSSKIAPPGGFGGHEKGKRVIDNMSP